MKNLHIEELKEFRKLIHEVLPRETFRDLNPDFFKLTEEGIEFDSEKIDLTKYTSRCPVDHTASPLDKSSPNAIKQEQYNSSRLGCPASSQDLDLVIGHFEKIINLVPDDKFAEWVASS